MAQSLAKNLNELQLMGIDLQVGSGAPTQSAHKGTLYVNTAGSTTNDRLYINTDGGTTWTYVTCGA